MVERIKKTLYYGEIDELNEVTDCPSLPLTEAVVDLMENALKLKHNQKMDDFNLNYASTVSEKACISPCSVVLAVIYMDRLKRKNPDYLRSVSPCDLFLVSMLVASKYLFDDGEEEEVFNDEWANSASLSVKELNKREREFLAAIDWRLYVTPDEFFQQLTVIEMLVTWKQTRKRVDQGLTYNELVSLAFNGTSLKTWLQFSDAFLKMIMVTFVTYSAVVLTTLGATILACSFHMMVQKSLQKTQTLCPTISHNTTTTDTILVPIASIPFAKDHGEAVESFLAPNVEEVEEEAEESDKVLTAPPTARFMCNATSGSVYLILSNLLQRHVRREFVEFPRNFTCILDRAST